jgi:threonine dehydrogenase-like Zn-dependent dehydrogenase
MKKTNALWHLSPSGSALREELLSPPAEGWCEVESLCSLVSTGTETLVAKGLVPPQLFEEMRVPYMAGGFGFPVKYGYSMVGGVATSSSPFFGKTVHFMHPHQQRCMVKESDLFLVPGEITLHRATLAGNLETAVTAIWDSGVSIGDRAAVVGFGLVGSLVARMLSQMPAVELVVFEKNEARRALAERMGFQVPTDLRGFQNLEGLFDVAFHTSGTSEGLQTCIELVGKEGKVIELSWYGVNEVRLSLGGSFHLGRKRILSSQVSHLPAERLPGWDFRRRKEVVFELLKNPIFDEHIGSVIPFEKAPELFQKLRNEGTPELSWCIVY